MRTCYIFLLLFAVALLPQADARSKRRTPKRGQAERAKVVRPPAASFDAAAVNNPQTLDAVGPDSAGSAVVRIQILLDRAHFSPGEIDGHYGDNLRVALVGYQSARQLNPTGVGDPDTWKSLNADTEPQLIPYTITADDVKGPFEPVPEDMMAKAKLEALGYQSPQEELGERFHIDPKLLSELNPGKDLSKAGEEIAVPNVHRAPPPQAARVEVSKSNRTVTGFSTDGTIIAEYPATMGSEHDPLPIGQWKVLGVQRNPWFNYNPALFWDAKPEDAKARIRPGPNNPVGVVWIALSKEHYGIHGTPEPAKIGHTESHGCIRLTNWDAEELSEMVKPGTPATFQE